METLDDSSHIILRAADVSRASPLSFNHAVLLDVLHSLVSQRLPQQIHPDVQVFLPQNVEVVAVPLSAVYKDGLSHRSAFPEAACFQRAVSATIVLDAPSLTAFSVELIKRHLQKPNRNLPA